MRFTGKQAMIGQVVFVLSILAIQPCLAAKDNWTFKRRYGDTEIYTSQNKTRLTLIHKSVSIDHKQFKKGWIKKLEKSKKDMLSHMGITKWKTTKTSINRKGNTTKITLKGSYSDNSSKKTYFVEYHFYSNSNKLQLLLTNTSKRKLNLDSKTKNIQEFAVEYGF